MKYMGSKNRIAKHILPIMLGEAEKAGITKWVEPFVGGGNLIDKVPARFTRMGFDINPHTIAALIAIRDFAGELPESVSEGEYRALKGTEPSPIESWIRFVCSYGGRFDEGYAREAGSDETTFCGYGKRNALKQSPNLQGVSLHCASYEDLRFENSLIYCDIPYKGAKWYRSGLVPKFNHENFFNWCREQAKSNIVFVSEYSAPEDFELVWEGTVKTNFASQRKTATHSATEKLFRVKA